MVAPNWEHPRDNYGKPIPLLASNFAEADHEWNLGYRKWQLGLVRDYRAGGFRARAPDESGRYTDWAGTRPSPDDYMPDWPEFERTHFMMYEDTSEGTPISPPFATAEELAQWLADTGASAFADETASYDQWLRVAKGGFAPSMIMQDGVLTSGVAGFA